MIAFEDRFWSKVSIPPNVMSDCWLWLGSRRSFGHGAIVVSGKRLLAHRVAWELVRGPIPAGEGHFGTVVRHVACRNPSCVNPAHLALGTQLDNVADRVRDGTCARGERHGHKTKPESTRRGEKVPFAKLTAPEVLEMRRLWDGESRSLAALGARFGIGRDGARAIVTGEAWAHLPGARSPDPKFRRKLGPEGEGRVLEMLGRGMSNGAIADEFGCHISRIQQIARGRKKSKFDA